MSESDKPLRMNILGTQGGMLGLFINPVYISSLTMGFLPPQQRPRPPVLSRCCMVYEDLQDELPPPYRINHPVLHFCPKPPSQGLAQLYSMETNTSINWNCYNAKKEIIDGEKGTANARSPFKVSKQENSPSRLSKAAMHMHRFKNLCQKDPSGKVLSLKHETPSAVKCAAEGYQMSKRAFYYHGTNGSMLNRTGLLV